MTAQSGDRQWYVVYTKRGYEKRVASEISKKGFECFLPLQNILRQWSDRKKKQEVPLFPNYVFVKMRESQRPCLFILKGFVKYVSFDRKPVVVREKEIDSIMRILRTDDLDIQSEQYIDTGMCARITSGQFAGMEGIVTQRNGRSRLVIRISSLMKAFSVCVNIPAGFVKPLNHLATQT